MYYGGFTYQEARLLGVNLRRFFINQVSDELKRQNGKDPENDRDNRPLSEIEKERFKNKIGHLNPNKPKKVIPFNKPQKQPPEPIRQSRAPKHNTPDIRSLQNKERTNLPTRLIRPEGP